MKIAVCFSGQIRTGVICSPNILRYIGILRENCDFFVHTWDIETHSMNSIPRSSTPANVPTPASQQDLSDFYKIYNPVTMMVDKYNLTDHIEEICGIRVDKKTGYRTVSMLESMYESNQMKYAFEDKYQFKYDYVIRMRPDLVFGPKKSLEDDLKLVEHDNLILTAEFMTRNLTDSRMEDIFWISNSHTMDKVMEFYKVRAKSNFEHKSWKTDKKDYVYIQDHLRQWLRDVALVEVRPLTNNRLKIYWRSDQANNVDPMTVDGDPRRGIN